jgi:hypothetical protein
MYLLKCPILLLHGKQDYDIRPWQAKANFLKALEGRLQTILVKKGFWELRCRKEFDCKEINGMTRNVLDGDEGELWSGLIGNPVWLLLVNNATHNDLAKHEVVVDVLESWVLASFGKA